MKTGLQQHQSLRQELRINPRLYQAMDLLYMPLLDLQQHLKQELLSNPFLELLEPEEETPEQKDSEQEKEQKEKEEEMDWEEILLNGFEVGGTREQFEQLEYTEPVTVETKDLIDHLREQLQMLTLTPRQLLLAEEFLGSLVPIALAYSVAHYFSLFILQGQVTWRLMSDPFGWGWNLFGTLGVPSAPILPNMSWVWHTQVALILFGHIASVYLAHAVALRVFPARRDAMLSQVPMLCLMVFFTVAGRPTRPALASRWQAARPPTARPPAPGPDWAPASAPPALTCPTTSST